MGDTSLSCPRSGYARFGRQAKPSLDLYAVKVAMHRSTHNLDGQICPPYSKGQKNDFNDAEAITEAMQRPTMKFVATRTAEQLDPQALHRVREGRCKASASPCAGPARMRY